MLARPIEAMIAAAASGTSTETEQVYYIILSYTVTYYNILYYHILCYNIL